MIMVILATAACASPPLQSVTPMPPDVTVVAPGADVPPDVAAFGGTWVGQFHTADVPMNQTLVVMRIEKDGDVWRAHVLFSHGEQPLWGYGPGYVIMDGSIGLEGKLRLAPLPDGARITYVMSPRRNLEGELVLGGLHAYGTFVRAPR
jgi:hypothetical protein